MPLFLMKGGGDIGKEGFFNLVSYHYYPFTYSITVCNIILKESPNSAMN